MKRSNEDQKRLDKIKSYYAEYGHIYDPDFLLRQIDVLEARVKELEVCPIQSTKCPIHGSVMDCSVEVEGGMNWWGHTLGLLKSQNTWGYDPKGRDWNGNWNGDKHVGPVMVGVDMAEGDSYTVVRNEEGKLVRVSQEDYNKGIFPNNWKDYLALLDQKEEEAALAKSWEDLKVAIIKDIVGEDKLKNFLKNLTPRVKGQSFSDWYFENKERQKTLGRVAGQIQQVAEESKTKAEYVEKRVDSMDFSKIDWETVKPKTAEVNPGESWQVPPIVHEPKPDTDDDRHNHGT